MKKIFLLLAFVFALNTLSAQSFTIKDEAGNNVSNTEMTFTQDPPEGFLTLPFSLVNETSIAMKLGVRKIVISADEYIVSTFCTAGACWPMNLIELEERPIIAAGDNIRFDADFFADDEDGNIHTGTIVVKYEIYSDESDDIATLTITFNSGKPVGIVSYKKKFETSVYPNPVLDVANINYQLPENVKNATLTIMSYTGSKIKVVQLPQNDNKVSVNVSDLPSGIYLYTINCGGKVVATDKLVVR